MGSRRKHKRNMKRYSLTSSKFSGEVIYEFGDDGSLSLFDLRGAELTLTQKKAMYNCVPTDIDSIHIVKTEHSTITEIISEITFDMFWNKYDDKLSSSKKRARAKWFKMNSAEQVKAYNYIQKYFRTLEGGIRKKYAETYLNAETWNN